MHEFLHLWSMVYADSKNCVYTPTSVFPIDNRPFPRLQNCIAIERMNGKFKAFVQLWLLLSLWPHDMDTLSALFYRWNEHVILMKFSSLAALKVVILTSFSATSDENFIKRIFLFQFCWGKFQITILVQRSDLIRIRNSIVDIKGS